MNECGVHQQVGTVREWVERRANGARTGGEGVPTVEDGARMGANGLGGVEGEVNKLNGMVLIFF